MQNSWFVFMLFISVSQSGYGFLGLTGWRAYLPEFFRLESDSPGDVSPGESLADLSKVLDASIWETLSGASIKKG